MLDWSNPFRALFIWNKATTTPSEKTNTLFCGDSLDISDDGEQIAIAGIAVPSLVAWRVHPALNVQHAWII